MWYLSAERRGLYSPCDRFGRRELWLRLADVYWSPEGIESLKAGAIAAALLAIYGFGQPFWHAVAKELFRQDQNVETRNKK